MLAVIGATEHYVRHEGIHPKASEELAVLLPKPTTPAAKRLRRQLLEFVQDESQHTGAGERGQHGLTGMVLSIGALVGKQTVATVQTAMSEITNQQVWDWCGSHLGPTVQSVRGRIRLALCPEQKQKPLLLESG